MKLRRKKSVDKGAPRWMVTYADMVTLILVFFILLFSMSQVDLVKFQAISESFKNRMIFDHYPSPIPLDHPTENIEIKEDKQGSIDYNNEPVEDKQDSLDSLLAEVESFLNENELNNVISATRSNEGVVLVLQEKVLFDSGEAFILESGKPFLHKVGTLLSKIPNQVRVEGHTDSRPISNYRYPSNWELSGARASSVIRYIVDSNGLEKSRFSAVGYGDTQPIVDNNSPQNWSKNRRVEIVIVELDKN